MRIQPEFPLCRVDDPMRRAEQTIYRILEESEAPGRALYEARILPHGRQIDFPVWIEGVARYAIEAKGGRYIIDPENGEWRLLTDAGRLPQASPPAQAWDAARSIPEVIRERFHRGVYIIAVLAFPDMEPDQVIAAAAAQRHVDVIFGADRWVERLVELAGPHRIMVPPTAEQIDQEVALVMPELAPRGAADPRPQVVIQHVEHLHLHAGPEGVEGLSGLTGAG
jgi:hypothetical protein